MWINKNLVVELTESFGLRIRALVNACFVIAGVLVLHADKLHIPHPYDDWAIFAALVVIAFNHSVKEN